LKIYSRDRAASKYSQSQFSSKARNKIEDIADIPDSMDGEYFIGIYLTFLFAASHSLNLLTGMVIL